MPFYAVAKGRIPGIYHTWNDCKLQIDKYKGALYKKFDNELDAKKFVNPDLEITPKINKELSNYNQNEIFPNKSTQDYYVYTDGACSNNGKSNAKAGIGIYFSDNDPRNVSRPIIGKQTNNVAELTAIIETYPIIKDDIIAGKNITIVTDSDYSLKCIHSYGAKLDSIDWTTNIPNKELVKKIYTLFKPLTNVSFKHINSHTGKTDTHSIGNSKADELANLAIGISQKESKIYLNVPFKEKDQVKKFGARWDLQNKKWYIFSNNPHKNTHLSKYL